MPRGVNWPSFEYACSDGYGYSNSASAQNVGPDAAGAALIASWHINTVRLPLNQDCWLGEDGLPKFGKTSGYRAAVRRWVSALHEAGLAVVLDLHWSGPAGVVSDGQRAMPDDRSDDFWSSVARTFKKDRSVIFDVFNEPYSRYDTNGTLIFDLTWNCWRNGGCAAPRTGDRQALDGGTFTTIGLGALVDAIRATGAKQPIMLGGIDYASDLRAWLANRPEDKGVVASFHNYGGHACHNQTCWDEVIAPIAAEAPVVTGEFGETDCQTSPESFMKWADQHGVGYLMWAWWVLPDSACSTLSVLADVRGTARAPNGTALKAHLAALAPRVSLSGRGNPVARQGGRGRSALQQGLLRRGIGPAGGGGEELPAQGGVARADGGAQADSGTEAWEEGAARGGGRARAAPLGVRADHDRGRTRLAEESSP